MAALTRLGVGGSAAAYKFEPAEVISLDATKGVVSVSGTTGILLSPVAYDAIKGVISIQSKPAISVLHSSLTTKDIVYVVGKQADLLTSESFDNAVSGAVSVSGTTGTLLSSGAYDAIKGVISIQSKPAISILQASSATKDIVYVVGKQADLLTSESFDNAVSGAVSVSGTTGTLLSSGAYDAIKGVIDIQSKPATSILQASSATKDIVYVVGKQADLLTGESFDNATTAQITIAGKTAEAVAVMMQALPDNVIIRGNDAEFVQYAILDAISGSVSIAGLPAELREGAEPTDAIAAALRVLGVNASINDTMIIIPHRSRVLIIKGRDYIDTMR